MSEDENRRTSKRNCEQFNIYYSRDFRPPHFTGGITNNLNLGLVKKKTSSRVDLKN